MGADYHPPKSYVLCVARCVQADLPMKPAINTNTDVVMLAPTPPPTHAAPSRVALPVPMLCRGVLGFIRHPWTYLEPTDEQLIEVRRLISHGRSGELGAAHANIFDRVCPRCFTAECRMPAYIDALRRARGETTTIKG